MLMTEEQISGMQNNPHAAQLRRGFPWLRFEPSLEQEFMQNYWADHRLRIRRGLIAGAIIFLVFSIKDIMILPRSTWIWTVPTVDGFIVPVLLLGALLTLSAQYKPWITKGSHIVLMLVWMGFVATLLQSRALGSPIPYESMMLTIAYILFATGLRAIPAVTSCMFGVVLYLIGIWMLGANAAVMNHESFHLIAITAIGAIGAYARESMLRRLFLTQSLASFHAEHDSLTQLLNKSAAMRRIKIAWRQAARQREQIAIFMIDADHFKAYNDRHGHIEGDKCLQSIGKAIKEPLHRPMDLAARFGGEEFVALAYGACQKDAAAIADRIRIKIENTKIALANGDEAQITVSIGIASIMPAPIAVDADIESKIIDVLQLADAALYAAKSAGRNRVAVS